MGEYRIKNTRPNAQKLSKIKQCIPSVLFYKRKNPIEMIYRCKCMQLIFFFMCFTTSNRCGFLFISKFSTFCPNRRRFVCSLQKCAFYAHNIVCLICFICCLHHGSVCLNSIQSAQNFLTNFLKIVTNSTHCFICQNHFFSPPNKSGKLR